MTDLVQKPINWICNCALRSFLLPHSSDDCSSKTSAPCFCQTFFEIDQFLRLLAQARARATPAPLRQATITTLIARWSALLTHASMHAFAAFLLNTRDTNCNNGDGALPTPRAPVRPNTRRHCHPKPTLPGRWPHRFWPFLDFGFPPLVDWAHLETGQYKNSQPTTESLGDHETRAAKRCEQKKKVNSWNLMEIPRLYLLVLGKYYDLGPSSISPTHLVANRDFSLQPVFTTKWLRKVIL